MGRGTRCAEHSFKKDCCRLLCCRLNHTICQAGGEAREPAASLAELLCCRQGPGAIRLQVRHRLDQPKIALPCCRLEHTGCVGQMLRHKRAA